MNITNLEPFYPVCNRGSAGQKSPATKNDGRRHLAYHENCRRMDSIDEIIKVYRRDVDMTLIDASLRRSVEERLQALEEFERFREELREAMERRRDKLR